MHIVFSIDDSTDSFWPSTAPETSPESAPAQSMAEGMSRSQSEWAFQRLLKEMSGSDETNRSPPPVQSLSTVEIQNSPHNHQGNGNPGVDPDQYHHAILKSKLDLACAAVARRVGTVKGKDSSASSSVNLKQSQPQGSVVAQQTSPGASSVRSVPSTSIQKKPDVSARQTTSVSSRDDSDDDDDLDGDADNGDRTDVKRARRMLSNRESARRSRRRKQEQMNEFDTQVGQLRGEHSTLISSLRDMNHKCDAAAIDNRILRADIETLRTKVTMSEETVKRVNPLHWASDSSRITPNS